MAVLDIWNLRIRFPLYPLPGPQRLNSVYYLRFLSTCVYYIILASFPGSRDGYCNPLLLTLIKLFVALQYPRLTIHNRLADFIPNGTGWLNIQCIFWDCILVTTASYKFKDLVHDFCVFVRHSVQWKPWVIVTVSPLVSRPTFQLKSWWPAVIAVEWGEKQL